MEAKNWNIRIVAVLVSVTVFWLLLTVSPIQYTGYTGASHSSETDRPLPTGAEKSRADHGDTKVSSMQATDESQKEHSVSVPQGRFDLDDPHVLPKAWMKPFHGKAVDDPKAKLPMHQCNGAHKQPDDPTWLWRNEYDTITDLRFFHSHEIVADRLHAVMEKTNLRGRLPVLYLFNSELKIFRNDVFPKLKEWYPNPEPHQRIVIFGPSNYDAGPQRAGNNNGWSMDWALEIADSPHVAAWFNENCDLDHPKILCAPIGIDFHTQVDNDGWGPRMSSSAQSCMMTHYYRHQLPWSQRTSNLIVYLDFSLNAHKHMRNHLYPMFQGKSWTMYERGMGATAPRHKIWERYSRLAFVLAPPGHGFDTHRIWESIALGSVPIVQRSEPFYKRYIGRLVNKGDELYNDLPVIIVNDYSEVTEQKLTEWHAEIAKGWQEKRYNLEKLFMPFWAQRVKAVAKAAFSEVSPKLPHDSAT